MQGLEHYRLIAELFDYPDEFYPVRVEKVLQFLRGYHPEAAKEVESFYVNLPKDNLNAMQELFTRSFDVQAITTLDIGYVLFGDDYKRGELLANLSREHRQAHNDCGRELADYLPNMLRLIAALKDEELVGELVREIVVPALAKMVGEFDPQRIDSKNKLYEKHYKTLIETARDKAAIYGHALKALDLVLRKDFHLTDAARTAGQDRDFLGSIGAEMVIEEITSE